jgi:hypothetical protein
MEKPDKTDVAVRSVPWWRWALFTVVLFSLTASLVTRTFRLTFPHGVTIKSGAAQAMRQHLNRDAARFAPPARIVSALPAPTFYPYVAPAGLPLAVLLLDQSLSNRPPPSC